MEELFASQSYEYFYSSKPCMGHPKVNYPQRNTNAARGRQPQTPAPPAARAGLHQLVARKGGTHVGLGLPGLQGGARRGWVAGPQTTLSPFPLTHTHPSSTT